MRPRRARLDSTDLELDPVAPFKMMDSSIERQQEFKVVLVRAVFHIISCHDMLTPESGQFQRRQVHGGRVPGGGASFRDIGITTVPRDKPRRAPQASSSTTTMAGGHVRVKRTPPPLLVPCGSGELMPTQTRAATTCQIMPNFARVAVTSRWAGR